MSFPRVHPLHINLINPETVKMSHSINYLTEDFSYLSAQYWDGEIDPIKHCTIITCVLLTTCRQHCLGSTGSSDCCNRI